MAPKKGLEIVAMSKAKSKTAGKFRVRLDIDMIVSAMDSATAEHVAVQRAKRWTGVKGIEVRNASPAPRID